MAWSLVTSAATSNKTGTNSTVIILLGAEVGDLVVVGHAVDSAAAATIVAPAFDDVSNSYDFVPGDGTPTEALTTIGDAGGRVNAAISYAVVTTAGDLSVSVDFASTWTAAAICGWVFRPSAGATISVLTGVTAVVNATSGVTMTCAAGAGQSAGDLIVGVLGWEGPDSNYSSGDADTTGGAWNTAITAGTSGGSAVTNIGICSQWKCPSSGTSQSFSSTLTTARDYAGAIVGFNETVLAAAPVRRYPHRQLRYR